MKPALVILLALIPFIPWTSASADISRALTQKLTSPVGRWLIGSTPEGRTLMNLGAPELIVPLPQQAQRWEEQASDLVARLQAAGLADDVYLRLLRSEAKLCDTLDPASSLLSYEDDVARNLSSAELETLLAVASQEFAIGKKYFWSSSPTLRPTKAGGTGYWQSSRANFIAGAAGGKNATPFERSAQTLTELAETPDGAYLLFRTDEGQILFKEFSPQRGILSEDPARLLVRSMIERGSAEQDSEWVIGLAFRLSRALHKMEALRSKIAIPARGNMRQAALKRIAKQELATERGPDGQLRLR